MFCAKLYYKMNRTIDPYRKKLGVSGVVCCQQIQAKLGHFWVNYKPNSLKYYLKQLLTLRFKGVLKLL